MTQAATQAVKPRIGYIDIAKGFAMLCIIAGHFGIVSANRIIYTFHVPLFFLLSGYFLSTRQDLRTFIKTKAKQLLLPYYVTGIVIIVFATFIGLALTPDYHVVENAGSILGALAYGAGTPHADPFVIRQIGLLWFLWALFIGMIIVRLALTTQQPLLVVSIVALIGWQTSTYVWLPLSIQSGCMASFFLYMGFWARQNKILSLKPSPLLLAALAVLWLICIYGNVSINIVSGDLGGGLLCVANALGASYLILVACRFTEQHFKTIARALNFIGQTTLPIMCFHAIADYTFPNYLLYTWLGPMGVPMPLMHIIVVALNIAWPLLGVAISYQIAPLRKLLQLKPISPISS